MKHIRKKYIILPLISIAIILTVRGAICLYRTGPRQRDYQRIASEQYDTVLMSMFPVSTYPLDLFYEYRLMTVLAVDYVIPDIKNIREYMACITRSGNTVSTVYLGFLPDKVTLSELARLAENYPSVTFEFIMAYPFCEYWENLSEQEYQRILDAYCSCLADVSLLTNANLYFFGSYEFLITNPSLYKDNFLVSEDGGFFLVANSAKEYSYLVTPGNCTMLADSLRSITAGLRSTPPVYPDYSDKTMVFLGDSIIGYFEGGMSVPGVVKGLTGADTYNLGYGGASATVTAQTTSSLPDMLKAFYEKDTAFFPEDTQAYTDIQRFWASETDDGRNLCYILNFGLNDYFCSCPISSADPYDTGTFTGAIRAAVADIRKHSPKAQIILCTPTYSALTFDRPGSETLEAYVNAIFSLAEELNVDVADNFHNSGISKDNYEQYLTDKVHPNEAGRFMIARNILHAIRP